MIVCNQMLVAIFKGRFYQSDIQENNLVIDMNMKKQMLVYDQD